MKLLKEYRLNRPHIVILDLKMPGMGTGLGLSIFRKIVEEHKGKIILKNKIDKGASFLIVLPA